MCHLEREAEASLINISQSSLWASASGLTIEALAGQWDTNCPCEPTYGVLVSRAGHIKHCWLIASWLASTLLGWHSHILRYRGPAQATQIPVNRVECRLHSWVRVLPQMLLSNVYVCIGQGNCMGLGMDRLGTYHLKITETETKSPTIQSVSILIDLTVSRFWRGGIVQWFPDLINAGEKSRRGPKKGDKISDRISGSPGLTVGWPPVPVLCSPLCVLLPANVIKLFYRLSGWQQLTGTDVMITSTLY